MASTTKVILELWGIPNGNHEGHNKHHGMTLWDMEIWVKARIRVPMEKYNIAKHMKAQYWTYKCGHIWHVLKQDGGGMLRQVI
jgi:hypothetical protein